MKSLNGLSLIFSVILSAWSLGAAAQTYGQNQGREPHQKAPATDGQFYRGENSATYNFSIPQSPSSSSEHKITPDNVFQYEPIYRDYNLKLESGGDVSGGGSSIRFEGKQPFLVDFIMVNPGFIESNGFAAKNPSIFNQEITAENAITGLPLDLKSQLPEVHALMEKRLALWEKNSPYVTKMIRDLVGKISWRATVLKFRFLEDRHYPKSVKVDRKQVPLDTISAVIQGHGVFIISHMFDTVLTGNTSRSGLLIHESLRSLQVEYSSRLRTETIQKITAHLMLTDPKDLPKYYLDQMFYKDLWFEEGFSGGDLHFTCRLSPVLVEGFKRQMKFASIQENVHFDVARTATVELDRIAARWFPKEHALKTAPLSEGFNPSQLEPRVLNFWLGHYTDALKTYTRGVAEPTLVPGGPMFSLVHVTTLGDQSTWEQHLTNIEALRKEACASRENRDLEKQNLFISMNRTLLKLAELASPRKKVSFHRMMSPTGLMVDREKKKLVEEAFNEYFGGSVCKAVNGMDVTVLGSLGFAQQDLSLNDCKPFPIKHFKNGKPKLPQTDLK